jgi:hypothetical protein
VAVRVVLLLQCIDLGHVGLRSRSAPAAVIRTMDPLTPGCLSPAGQCCCHTCDTARRTRWAGRGTAGRRGLPPAVGPPCHRVRASHGDTGRGARGSHVHRVRHGSARRREVLLRGAAPP